MSLLQLSAVATLSFVPYLVIINGISNLTKATGVVNTLKMNDLNILEYKQFCDTIDCGLPLEQIYKIIQARILKL